MIAHNQMSHQQLRELQTIQYGMLQEVDIVCKKYGITYFLVYGTLLGAVRHKGSIPWDYDIDIAMTRAELKRFLSHKDELPAPLYMEDICYAEIDYAGLTRVQKPGHPLFGTIHIDIFVLDYAKAGFPETKIGIALGRFLHCAKLSKNEKDILLRHFKGNMVKQGVVQLARVVGAIFGGAAIEKAIFNMRVSVRPTGKLLILEDSCLMAEKCFDEAVNLQYEQAYYLCPVGYNELLSIWYGNYMEIPPEGQKYLLEEKGLTESLDRHL